jgi:hypothetical protein
MLTKGQAEMLTKEQAEMLSKDLETGGAYQGLGGGAYQGLVQGKEGGEKRPVHQIGEENEGITVKQLTEGYVEVLTKDQAEVLTNAR